MSSHLPGFPGIPIIPGLAGPSGVLGHNLTQGDRRRQEADNKAFLNLHGLLHSPSNTTQLALSSPMLSQSGLSPHPGILPGGMAAHSSNVTGGLVGSNNTSDNLAINGRTTVLELHHRSSAVIPESSATSSEHPVYGVGGSAGAVAVAAAAAAAVAAAGGGSNVCANGGASVGELRVGASRCPVCFRHFDNRWKLERHARVHTGERPFACSRCTKTFTRKEHLTRHELSHDGDLSNSPSTNETTAESQTAVNALVLYRDAERGEETAVTVVRADGCRCPVCFRHFGDRWKLERHARVHTGERPFTCERCGNSFRRKEHLVRHERSHDVPLNVRYLPEGSASGESTNVEDYRFSGGTPATAALRVDACRCPVCFRHFGDRWKLERHARIHTGERPFTCGRCGKSFTTKEHLVRHEMSHGGEKPYSCSVCGKSFTRKDHVDRHLKKTHCRSKYTNL